jgi:hypothetical protein
MQLRNTAFIARMYLYLSNGVLTIAYYFFNFWSKKIPAFWAGIFLLCKIIIRLRTLQIVPKLLLFLV